jgi:hypothetical protein
VKGVANNLKVGDALVFIDPDFLAHPMTNTNWDFRLIDTVDVEAAADRTHLSWQVGLAHTWTPADPTIAPQLHVLRKRAAVFGNNAPMWRSMNGEFKNNYPPDPNNPNEWPSFNISISELPADVSGGHVDLDAVFGEIKPGGLVILTRVRFDLPTFTAKALFGGAGGIGTSDISAFSPRPFTRLYKVSSTTDVSRAEFAISGKVTRLGLEGQDLPEFSGFPRETSVYAQSERLAVAPYPVTAAIDGDQLPLAVPPDGLQPERRLIVKGERVDNGETLVHEATLVSVRASANNSVLTITPRLPAAL